MVATNRPMATNEVVSPMASATGPSFCSVAAAPCEIGRIGRTHGARIDSIPAAKASTRLPIAIGERSQYLVQEGGDRAAVGVADRAALLLVALERDQRRLHARAEATDEVLLAVEVDREIEEILELGIGHQLGEDRRLRLADRTPGRVNADTNRLAGLLRGSEGRGIKGQRTRGKGRRRRARARGEGGDEGR